MWPKCATLEEFQRTFHTELVPEHLVTIIHKAILQPSGNRLKVEEALTKEEITPEFFEFVQVIQAASAHSAGGPSKLTYRVLQDCPLKVLGDIYQRLRDQWEKGKLDDWLSQKLLYPIEKKPLPHTDVDNVRPIMLLEVLRKIWGKIIIRKIRTALERNGLFHRNQQGFRQGRNTSTGILQLINAIEESQETGDPLLVTSWDIKAAFDSVNRDLIELALRRMGIPQWLATYLRTIDDNDSVTIALPFVSDKMGKTFRTERGVGQGDSISPLIWIIFFDILLTAIDNKSGISYIDPDGFQYSVEDGAFADDLLSFAGSREIMQQKADIVSAFGLLFDIQFSNDKFRAFTCNVSEPLSIDLHVQNWKKISIEYNNQTFLKYLGATIDNRGSSVEESRRIKQLIGDALNRYQGKIDTPAHHLSYGARALLPAIVYKSQFASIGNHRLRTLARGIDLHHKKQLHVQQNFPSALLHGNWTDGGLGAADAALTTSLRKLREIHSIRNYFQCPQHRQAVAGILARELNRQRIFLSPQGSKVEYQEGAKTTWLSGLLQTLQAADLELRYVPHVSTNELDKALPPAVIKALQPWQVEVYGDVARWTGDGWALLKHDALKKLSLLNPRDVQMYPRPGQFWTPRNREDQLWQICGWTLTNIIIQEWDKVTTQTRSARNKGASYRKGNMRALLVEEIEECKHRAITTKSSNSVVSLVRKFEAPLTPRVQYRGSLNIPGFKGRPLASDGSWISPRSLFDTTEPIVGAAIVTVDHPREALFISGFNATSRMRVFTQEAIAAAVAIAAGCKALVVDNKAVVKQFARRGQTDHEVLNLVKTPSTGSKVGHIKAHPERMKLPSQWSPEEWANSEADSVATGKREPTKTWSGLEVSEKLHEVAQGWAIWNQEGIIMDDIGAYINRKHLHDYLEQRTDKKDGVHRWNHLIFRWSMQGKVTPRQRAAHIKLHLARFDRDRKFLEGTLPACSCGCGNTLETWISSCQRSECRAINENTRADISLQLTKWTSIQHRFLEELQSTEAVFLWRANPQTKFRQELEKLALSLSQREYDELKRAIKNSFRILVDNALTLHSLATKQDSETTDHHQYSRREKKRTTYDSRQQSKATKDKPQKISVIAQKCRKLTELFGLRGESEP